MENDHVPLATALIAATLLLYGANIFRYHGYVWADQVCLTARPYDPAFAPRPRRRGDRIRINFAASAHDRLWHKAAVPRCPRNGRYRGQSGHVPDGLEMTLMTHMRHRRDKVLAPQNDCRSPFRLSEFPALLA